MNETTTLPLDFAPLREGAEEMAREAWEAERAACYRTTPDHWVYRGDWGHGRGREFRIEGCTRLLSDLTIDATRDRWVRWGIERDTAAYEAEADVKWARAVAGGYSEDVMAVLSDAWERAKMSDRRVLREQWYSLRDNPEALRAAILAALETK